MDKKEIKKTLEKQLELLSERSKECVPCELATLTEAMCMIAKVMLES